MNMGDATNVSSGWRPSSVARRSAARARPRALAPGPTQFGEYRKQVHVARWLGEQLARIGDVRVVPLLEVASTRRTIEPAIFTTLLAALAGVQRRPADVERLLAIVDEPTQIEQLWQRAAHDRDARGVLADALVAHGEARGTYLALARSGNPSHARKAARLLVKNWERWLGSDLALVAVHDGTELHDGMIEVLRAGPTSRRRGHGTPSSATTSLRGPHGPPGDIGTRPARTRGF